MTTPWHATVISSTRTSTRSRRLGGALLALCLAAGACAETQAVARGGAADFALRDLEGRTVRLSDYRGKVVLLNFWATWCVPCAAELPHLVRLSDGHAERGLVVLAVSMDGPESVADVGSHARRYGLTFAVLLDEETRVVGRYNPKRAAPFTVLIGRDGSIASTREGYSAGDEIALEAEIKALLDR
ncbi:MAG: TlpA disulfide reductase family protein [Myxococcota bacterium]